MRLALALLLITGCNCGERIVTDASMDAATDAPDAMDATPDVVVDTSLDGGDVDSSDGDVPDVDAAVPCTFAPTGTPQLITTGTSDSKHPDLEANGSTIALAWSDDRVGVNRHEIYFTHLDPSTGARTIDEVRITTDASTDRYADLVAAGDTFGLVWRRLNDPFFAQIARDGAVRVVPTMFTTMTSLPGLTWTGTEFVVCAGDFSSLPATMRVARLSAVGAPVGGFTDLATDASPTINCTATWDGDEVAVFFNRDADVAHVRADAAGALVPGSESTVGTSPRIVNDIKSEWTGSVHGVAWREQGPEGAAVAFQVSSRDGAPMGPPFRVTTARSNEIGLTWTGTEFAVAWQDSLTVFIHRISATGEPIDFPITVATTSSSGVQYDHADVIWTGAAHLVVWKDGPHLYGQVVECVPD